MSRRQILSISNCFFNSGTIETFSEARSGLQSGGQFCSEIKFFLDLTVLRLEFLGSGIMHYLDVQMTLESNFCW